MALLLGSYLPASAQVSSNSSLSGSVVDPSGAVIPGADVTVTNEGTGAVYKVVTAGNGTFQVPSLNSGTYTVTVDVPGFKQAVMKGVVVLTATAAAVKPIKLEIGSKGETVIVEAAGEVMQTQSATVSTTIIGRQITEIPFTSRDALDLVLLLPETFTSTNPRSSVVNGLPKSSINITIDGINVQNNEDKAGDGFYTWIRPRIDSVEQVTVSTSAQSADSAGEGAVQIKFVTRSGNNKYSGSLYEYHRNPSLAANYWFNNRDYRADASKGQDWRTFKAPKDRVLLNQYGSRFGGPISLPKRLFGPLGFDGHDKAFFFVNYEEFKIPYRVLNNRTILHPRTQQGFVRYLVTDATTGARSVQEVNLMALAASNGQVATFDPTIQKLLADIRQAATSTGSIIAIEDPEVLYRSNMNPNTQAYSFVAKGGDRRYFSTFRLDFNLSRKHRLENSYSYQRFANDKFDYFQGGQPQFPDFPNTLQTLSNRFSDSLTLRSTITAKLVNEAQWGITGGTSGFGPNISAADFRGSIANQDGFTIGLLGGITGATTSTTPNRRQNPVNQFTDTLTWMVDTHSISMGGSFTQAGMWYGSQTVVPSISLGVDSTYDPAYPLFTSANRPLHFPGANSTDASRAQSLYAMFTGRVTGISASANLGSDGKYQYIGPSESRGRMRQMGFYVSDSWRVFPSLTLTGGLRVDGQLAYVGQTDAYSQTTLAGVWGISGIGNLRKPGTMTGTTTTYTAYEKGTPLFKNSWELGPSLGFAWTPKLEGFLGSIFGRGGQSVFRGGFSLANNRYGSSVFSGILTSTPGRSITATRSVANANLVSNTGSDVWPLLFRQKERLGPPTQVGGVPLPTSPIYPNNGLISDGGGVFDPNFQMSYAMSWNFSLQREISRNMVIEARYTGNRALQFNRSFGVNSVEYNILENGIYEEFLKAQANWYVNLAAGNQTWKYTGIPGTSPLPIALAFLQGLPASSATDPTKYTSSQFGSVNGYIFDKKRSYLTSYPALFDGNATYRANGLAAGYPANIFRTNPDKRGGPYWIGNGGRTDYHALTVEFRRRMVKGLLVAASFNIGRSFELDTNSLRQAWYKAPGVNATIGAFKANWIYELPIGRGKTLFSGIGPKLNLAVGGWEFHGMTRIQTGNPMWFYNNTLVGMTRAELQQMVNLRDDPAAGVLYWLPEALIQDSYRANNTDPSQPTGYATAGTWSGAPQGPHIAPAGYNGCNSVYATMCGHGGYILYGLPFARWDLSLIKRVQFTERVNFELRAEFLNAFNNINFRANQSFTSGQVTTAYRDVSTTNDTGGRMVQFVARLNF
jgi:hypothetical protein